MKKVVITGATSMLGIALINECIIHEIHVLAVIRPNSHNSSRIPQSDFVKVVECELNSLQSLQYIGEYDAFYHFAWGHTSKSQRNNPLMQNLNVNFTLDAVNLAKTLGCKIFIGAGSQAEYGRADHTITPQTPVNPENAYGIAKYAAGKLSAIYCESVGIINIWIRIFSIYGLYDNPGTMIRYSIEEILQSRQPLFTKCEQKWDYLYSADAGRAFYLIGEKCKKSEVYCLGSGTAYPLREYIDIISHLMTGKESEGIGKLEYAPNQVMNLCADITALTEDTGFKPETKFEDGIKKTIEWCKTNEIY